MLCAALLGVSPVRAQESAPPYPLDIVPDKMPFDIPYGTPISLERAEAAPAATMAEAKKHDWKMCVVVLDSGRNLVDLQRMDGTQLVSIQISQYKAVAKQKYSRREFSSTIRTLR